MTYKFTKYRRTTNYYYSKSKLYQNKLNQLIKSSKKKRYHMITKRILRIFGKVSNKLSTLNYETIIFQ